MINKCISSVMAGMYISIGATAYILSENKFTGALLFCTGIFLVVNYYNMLFTKVVPFYAFGDYTIEDIIISFIGNFIGALIYAYLISLTRLSDTIIVKLNNTITTKMNDGYISLFIMGFFCAILVAYATLGEKIFPNNKGLSILFTFLFIIAFVICSFEHIVANMFYYSIYAINNGFNHNMPATFLSIMLGNIAGGLFTGYIEKYRIINCQKK